MNKDKGVLLSNSDVKKKKILWRRKENLKFQSITVGSVKVCAFETIPELFSHTSTVDSSVYELSPNVIWLFLKQKSISIGDVFWENNGVYSRASLVSLIIMDFQMTLINTGDLK